MQPVILEERAYSAIKDSLLNYKYHPGFRLVERDLAEQLKMSRTPVRQALLQLENEGYLERLANRGFCVREHSREEILNLLDVRAAIESMAAFRAATRRTEDHVAVFKNIVVTMHEAAASHDMLAYYRLSGDLHENIFDAAGNPELASFCTHVNSQSANCHFSTLLLPGRLELSVSEHEAIVKHIIARDEEKAGQKMRDHVFRVKELIASHKELAPGKLPL
ncbi:GntR family transcriptional regulator [Betaproteobacteria bacterium]|nr:GntR family transcriptional regulator [Betaproteobacteria bacterium]